MNFLSMKVVSSGTQFHAENFGLRIPLKSDPKSEHVIVGIRPEHIHLQQTERCVPITGTVYFAEKLMSETVIHLSIDVEKNLVIKVPYDLSVKEGEKMQVYLDLDQIHFFHPDTQERIEL